jgi:lysophospholipase L1-like esterase
MNVDQIIDKRTVAIPGPIGTVTPEVQALHDETAAARDTAKTYRDEARTFAGQSHDQLDQATTSLLDDPASNTAVALRRDATELVGIGDSWMQGTGADTGKSFMEIVSKHLGVNLHRYSIGGTGFNNQGTAGNGRYDNQAVTASNDTSYDHAKVRRVIVEGGTNDWGDKATAATVTQTVIDTMSASFPNARLLFVLCTGQGGKEGGASLRPAVNRGAFDTIERIAKANDADVLRGDYWINSLSPNGFNLGDGLHPGHAGHEFIAGQIISFLESGNTGKNTILNNNATRNFITWTPNAITPTGDLIAYDIGGGLLYLAGETTFTLPALGTPGIGYNNPSYSLCTLGSQGRFIDGFGVSYPNTPVMEIPAYLNDGASTPGYANSRARVTIESYGASGNNLGISINGQMGQVKPGTAVTIVWTGIILPLHGFAYSTS